MRPNIIFFLIDGLRVEQFYGNNRTCKTPNIDSLIRKGMYFEQTSSSADGTIISLNTIFSSNFQVAHASRYQKIVLNKNNLIDIFKKNGYHVYGIFPNFTSFNSLRECFENENNSYDWIKPNIPPETLPTGLAKKIIQLLESEKQEPCFYYFHIFDLHPLREGRKPIGIENFDNEKFGSSLYERTVSAIDFWLGKILEHVDLDNTILILTSDHGQSIPYEGIHEVDFEPRLETSKKIGLKFLPKSTHKAGGEFLYKIRKLASKRKLNKVNQKLTNYQKRSRETFDNVSIFDEMIHVPLLFASNHINSITVSDLVHNTDIFPTLCELVNIKLNQSIHGRNLVPLIEGNKIEEKPIYLRTRPYVDPKPNKRDSVGIRTSNYKYFRSTHNAKENVHLYDLENDPYENNNIARSYEQLVARFENKILELQKDNLSEYKEKIPDKEIKEISNELYKLGYM